MPTKIRYTDKNRQININQNFICKASFICNSYNKQHFSSTVTSSNWSEMQTKCSTSRYVVRARGWIRERRQRGRKKGKGSLYFTRRHAHVERGMQMCTKRRGHFAARCSRACPALFRLHPRPPFLLHLASSDIPWVYSRARTAYMAHNTQTYIYMCTRISRSVLRRRHQRRTRRDHHLLPFPNIQRSVDRSVRRSPDIISLEASGNEESHVYGV